MTNGHTESRADDDGNDLPPLEVAVLLADASTLAVEIRGELDLATVPILKQHLEPFARLPTGEGRRPKVVYRLAHLDFIDATGLDGLLTAVESQGPDTITVREPSPPVRRLLGLVGLESMIENGGQETNR